MLIEGRKVGFIFLFGFCIFAFSYLGVLGLLREYW